MRALRRARLALLAAFLLAAVLLATEVPISSILSTRSAVASTGLQLAQLRRENTALKGDLHALGTGSTIMQIAHEEYGLVGRGQSSVVVMPGGSAGSSSGAGGTSPLSSRTVPKADLVPSDAALQPPATPAAHEPTSYWQRLLHRLEFWKAYG